MPASPVFANQNPVCATSARPEPERHWLDGLCAVQPPEPARRRRTYRHPASGWHPVRTDTVFAVRGSVRYHCQVSEVWAPRAQMAGCALRLLVLLPTATPPASTTDRGLLASGLRFQTAATAATGPDHFGASLRGAGSATPAKDGPPPGAYCCSCPAAAPRQRAVGAWHRPAPAAQLAGRLASAAGLRQGRRCAAAATAKAPETT